jgi:hypothetical protein
VDRLGRPAHLPFLLLPDVDENGALVKEADGVFWRDLLEGRILAHRGGTLQGADVLPSDVPTRITDRPSGAELAVDYY